MHMYMCVYICVCSLFFLTIWKDMLPLDSYSVYFKKNKDIQVYYYNRIVKISSVSSVAQSCPTLCDPMNRSTSGLPVHHQLPESTQTQSIESVMPSSHLILHRPLLLLPPIPPSIRVFSNESTLHMRWPKYWSFSFSIVPSKEIPGLASFRMDCLDLLAVQRLVINNDKPCLGSRAWRIGQIFGSISFLFPFLFFLNGWY